MAKIKNNKPVELDEIKNIGSMELDEVRQYLERKALSINTLDIDRATINQEDLYVELSVTSEYPALIYRGVYEVLEHKKSSIRLDRFKDGASVVDTHWGDQIGVVEKAWLDSSTKKLRVGIRFSKNNDRAVVIYKDVIDGIRRNVSARFRIHKVLLEKETETERVYKVVDWEPIHVAFEPDGADPTVGIDRSEDAVREVIELDLAKNVDEQIESINRNLETVEFKIINKQKEERNMPPEEKKELTQEEKDRLAKEVRDSVRRAEETRVREFELIASDFKDTFRNLNVEKIKKEFIQDDTKKPMDLYRYLSEQRANPEMVGKPAGNEDLTDREVESYDLANAVLKIAEGKRSSLGIEGELHKSLIDKLRLDVSGENALVIPTNVFNAKLRKERVQVLKDRAEFNATTGSAGGDTVPEQWIPGSFIEYLSKRSAFIDAGITFYPNMSGKVPFIRELNEMTWAWVAESGAPASSGVAYLREEVDAKEGGARTSLSRRILMQSKYVSEAYAQRKLFGAAVLGIDRAIGYGLGTGNEPLGIKNVTDVNGFDGANFTRTKAIAMKKAINALNAEVGEFSFLANSNVIGDLQVIDTTDGYGKWLCDDNNMMLAKKVKESNQIDNGDLFYAAWRTVYLLEYGYLVLYVNPYGTNWASGDIELAVRAAVNTYVEYPQAISIAEGVSVPA